MVSFTVTTRQRDEFVDITSQIQDFVNQSGVSSGYVIEILQRVAILKCLFFRRNRP